MRKPIRSAPRWFYLLVDADAAGASALARAAVDHDVEFVYQKHPVTGWAMFRVRQTDVELMERLASEAGVYIKEIV